MFLLFDDRFCRERDLAEFATECHLPIIWDNCPACFRAPTERHRIKQLLASQEFVFPELFSRLYQHNMIVHQSLFALPFNSLYMCVLLQS